MRLFVATLLLVTGLFPSFCSALDFKITEVVEIEPIYQGGLTGPAQWSPDGAKLAYFYDGQLMIADTLGKSSAAAKIDLPPHRFVWASDSVIILYQRDYLPRDTVDQNMRAIGRMISINIETGTQTVLEEFVHRLGDKSETLPRLFKGPYLTVEGNAFYYVQENVQAGRKPPEAQIQMAPGVPPEKASLTQNHILRTAVPHSETLRATTDALYLVRADLMDSIKISNKFYGGYMGMPVSLSRDTTHIMFGGVIVRLADDKQIILDTLIQKFPKPEGTTACGFMDECFNPKFTEVAFRVTCDDGHNYVFDRMGVFDYTTNQFVILDTLLNLNNCQNPAYAPDGKRISFVSEGSLYFLKREI